MNITDHDFKKIRSCLKDNDIAKLVERTEYSKMTIHNALRGYSIDRTTRTIVKEALEIIKENEAEAKKVVKDILKKI
jgi:hypothetical protein